MRGVHYKLGVTAVMEKGLSGLPLPRVTGSPIAAHSMLAIVLLVFLGIHIWGHLVAKVAFDDMTIEERSEVGAQVRTFPFVVWHGDKKQHGTASICCLFGPVDSNSASFTSSSTDLCTTGGQCPTHTCRGSWQPFCSSFSPLGGFFLSPMEASIRGAASNGSAVEDAADAVEFTKRPFAPSTESRHYLYRRLCFFTPSKKVLGRG